MTAYLPRSEWNAAPRRHDPGELDPAKVKGVALHWPGMASPIISRASVASALRGWQTYHMAAPPAGHGWSDIAYQIAVDQAGRAWTLRGLTARSAANGDETVNTYYGAILLVLAGDERHPAEAPSPAMRTTVREVIADFRALYPRGTEIVPHSKIRPEPTDCPGDRVRAGIIRGDFTPLPNPEIAVDINENTVIGVDTTTNPPSAMTLGKFVARFNRMYDTTRDGDGSASDQTLIRRICAKLDIPTTV